MTTRDELVEAVAKRAYRTLRSAVERGDLHRPAACQKCGVPNTRHDGGRHTVHAYHYRGYDNPMDVEWVCRKCHRASLPVEPRATRRCNACGIERPLEHFFQSKTYPLGRSYRCRYCERERRRGETRPGRIYHSKEPVEKRVARRKVVQAVRYGKMKKPDICPRCGQKVPSRLMDGHHHNGYENALDIKWLCRRCHAAEHAGY